MSVGNAVELLENFFRQRLGQVGDIVLHEPWIHGNEWQNVRECLDSGWVSSAGGYVDRFEINGAKVSETKFAVATVNGTSALHVALIALGVEANDIVICPALSFIGTANAISYCGADPLFLDIDSTTLGLCANTLVHFLNQECQRQNTGTFHSGTGRRVAACVPVHVFGHPADMDPIVSACRAYDIPVLEDAAEALGSRYKGRPCGSLGTAGAFSFNGNKIITTGGGGMVVTDNSELASKIKHLSTTAKIPHPWQYHHDAVGFNYRLPNLNAALGCAQLEHLAKILELKRRLSIEITALFANTPDVEVFQDKDWAKSNKWLNAIFFADRDSRDAFLQETSKRGIHTRPCWNLLADLPIYENAPRMGNLASSRDALSRIVTLPSSPQLLAREAVHGNT